MSISRRGVKRRYLAAEDGCGGGSSRETRISSASSTVRPGPLNSCSTGSLRRPRLPAISAPASWQMSAGTASADGAALQMLPPRLARFWTCTPPIRRADFCDRRIGTRNCHVSRHGRRVGRGSDRDAAIRRLCDGSQRRDALEVDDAGGVPAPLAQLRNEVGAAGERTGVARRHGRDGLLDRLRAGIGKVPQRLAPLPDLKASPGRLSPRRPACHLATRASADFAHASERPVRGQSSSARA